MDLSSLALLIADLLGVFAFAISGNLLAARKNIDITGGLVLGILASLGGGILRDLLLDLPPTALNRPIYLVPPVLAAVFVYLGGKRVERIRGLVTLFDAAGLALFCMTGTVIALGTGINEIAAILLGVATAAGGGILRDVVANEVPAVFKHSDLYVTPAFLGALATVVLYDLGWFNALTGIGVAFLVFAFRVLAWRLGWKVPSSMRSWSYRELHAQLRRRGDEEPGPRLGDTRSVDVPPEDPDTREDGA